MNKLNMFFDIIAKANKLTHIGDNVYVDKNKVRYYLDKFGFHTSIQYGSHQLAQRKKDIAQREKQLKNEIHGEIIGQAKRSKILKIIDRRPELPDHEKLRLIRKITAKQT